MTSGTRRVSCSCEDKRRQMESRHVPKRAGAVHVRFAGQPGRPSRSPAPGAPAVRQFTPQVPQNGPVVPQPSPHHGFRTQPEPPQRAFTPGPGRSYAARSGTSTARSSRSPAHLAAGCAVPRHRLSRFEGAHSLHLRRPRLERGHSCPLLAQSTPERTCPESSRPRPRGP